MDIEDLVNEANDLMDERKNKNENKVKAKKTRAKDEEDENYTEGFNKIHPEHIAQGDVDHSTVPGTQKVHVKSYGCSHNASDAEYMMGLLYEYGYDIVDDVKKCDICIINSCTVKNPSQDAFITYVTKSKEFGKPVVVAGCVPQGDRNLKGLENCSIVGVTQIDRIVEVVEETLKGNIIRLLGKKEMPSLDLPKIRRNALIEIIPINLGCLGSCTYCKTKHARGKLTSYHPTAIVNACKKAWKTNAKELWITSEDTGVYGRDIGTDLPSLMIKILKDVPKDTMIRIGMANPPYIMEHLDKMCKVLNHPNVYSFIHIPVQSGSNAVLDKMLREYKVEDFSYVCDYFIQNVPNVTIATDIICGFPTETDANFEETLELVRKYKFPVINISQFYSRPGTVAAKWKKVLSQDVKKRSTALAKLFNSYQNYEHLNGTTQRVWLHDTKEEAKNIEEGFMVGHTKAYVKVLIKRDMSLLGRSVLCKITGIHKWHVYGEVIDKNPEPVTVNYEEYFKGLLEEKEIDLNAAKVDEVVKETIDIHNTFDIKIIPSRFSNKWSGSIMNVCYVIALLFMILGVYRLNK